MNMPILLDHSKFGRWALGNMAEICWVTLGVLMKHVINITDRMYPIISFVHSFIRPTDRNVFNLKSRNGIVWSGKLISASTFPTFEKQCHAKVLLSIPALIPWWGTVSTIPHIKSRRSLLCRKSYVFPTIWAASGILPIFATKVFNPNIAIY